MVRRLILRDKFCSAGIIATFDSADIKLMISETVNFCITPYIIINFTNPNLLNVNCC